MRPFTLLIKPAGPDCNLACKYCFYTRKQTMFPPGKHRMSQNVLETLVKTYLALQFPVSAFAFQGGEPTLMGLDFYRHLVRLEKKYGRNNQLVSNALQTNAILLDQQWCRFLAEYKFLVGISLDGPKRLHDYYRLNHAGMGTFDQVMAAIDLCRAHEVQFNILVLLNDKNVLAPDELFDFMLAHNFTFLQFIPCVERDPLTGNVADFSVTPQQYGNFMCRILDRWLDYGPHKLSVRLFDSIISYYLTGQHSNCSFARKCQDYIVIEHNGDAFACDFFVQPHWRLGNILQTPIQQLADGPVKRDFAQRKRQLANQCLLCRYSDICRGGCLKDRIILHDDYAAPSYFCPAYKQFFDHALPTLRQLAAQATTTPH